MVLGSSVCSSSRSLSLIDHLCTKRLTMYYCFCMYLLLPLLITSLRAPADAFGPYNTKPLPRDRTFFHAIKSNAVEDGISLRSLSDTERVASYLNATITKWLNKEYITLPVHSVIGEAVKEQYKTSINSGVLDLGELVMDIGTVSCHFE